MKKNLRLSIMAFLISVIGFGQQFSPTPEKIDFGDVPIGTTVYDTVTVSNTGSDSLIITSISSLDGYLSVTPVADTILTGESADFIVEYTGIAAGTVNDSLVFTGTASTDTVPMSAAGIYIAATDAGNAIEFDGSDDYIDLGNNDVFNNLSSGNFTIEMWINSTDNSTRSVLVGNYPASNCYNFELTGEGKLRTYMDGTSFYNDEVVADGTWHHIATVVDFDNDLVTMYIDGEVTSGASYTDAPYTVSGYSTLIGRDPRSGSSYPFGGQMDEVRFWNKALTADEIHAQYASLAGDEDGLVAYYRFDEGKGDYTYDYTGNGNTGTLINDPTRVVSSTAPVGEPVVSTTLPASIDFGTIVVPETVSETYKISNTGLGILHLNLSSLASNVSLSIDSLALFSGDTAEVTITFTPAASGDLGDTVVYTGNVNIDNTLITGSATFTAAADAGNAIKFDGTDDYVSCEHVDLYGTSFSLECWVKRENTGTNSYLLSQGENTANNVVHIGFDGSDYFRFGFGSDDLKISTAQTDTAWHHWACTYDYETGLMSAYKDGQVIGTRTATSGYLNTDENPFLIGTYLTTSYFSGQIDEVRVWTKALTQDEIQSQYASLVGDEDGLAAYWRFDEGDSTIVYDYSGNSNTGTLVNDPTRVIPSSAPIGEPAISTTLPESFDFGAVALGATDTLTYLVSNTGLGIVNIDLSNSESQFSIDASELAVVSGDTAEVIVTFTPDSMATFTDTLVYSGNVTGDSIPVTGNASYEVAADSGSMLDLDGSNDYVNCGTDIDLTSKSFSIDFWAKRGSTTGADFIISLTASTNGSTDNALHIGFISTNYFIFAFYGDDVNSSKTYTDTKWHHWACTYDYDTKAQTIYCDGVVVGTGESNESGFTGTGTLQIGRSYSNSDYFDGNIDEVRVWSKALTQDEIRAQYGSLTGDEEGLMAYWRFDEGSGTTVYDYSGNGHTGTLVNSPTRVDPSTAPVAQPVFTLAAESIDFGTVAINDSLIQTVTAYNTGGGILHIESAISDTSVFIPVTETANIFSGDSAEISVKFLPETEGSFSGEIVYAGNKADTLLINAEGFPGATLSVLDVSEETETSALVSWELSEVGSANPTSYGICWNTTGTPTVDDEYYNEGATNITDETSTAISGLTAATTYYVRAYATANGWTTYSEEYTFTTFDYPAITTVSVGNISDSSAVGTIEVSYFGIPDSAEVGICWSTNSDAAITDNSNSHGVTDITGTYNFNITGLVAGTTYYARAYAVLDSRITIYGDAVEFTANNAVFAAVEDTISIETVLGLATYDTISIENTGDAEMVISEITADAENYYIISYDDTIATAGTGTCVIAYVGTGDEADTSAIIFTSNAGTDTVTVIGTGTFRTAVDAGSAIEFDGSSDYIDLGNISTYNDLTLGNFSIEMWIKTTDDDRSVLIGNYGSNPSMNLEIHSDNGGGVLRTYLAGTSFTDDRSIADGEWHFIATVVDFDNDFVKMYIDGMESYSATNTVDPYSVSRNMMIGRDPRSGSYYYDGQMDEVRVWSKALTQAEIRSHYASLAGNEDELLAYYRFDEAMGDYAFDATGNGNTGTLVDDPTWIIPATAPLGEPVVVSTLPESIDFGTLSIGQGKSYTYTIYNTGGGFINIDSIKTYSVITCSEESAAISAGDSLALTVSFSSDTAITVVDSLVIAGTQLSDTIPMTAAVAGYTAATSAGSAISFDGSDDYITSSSSIDLTDDYSVDMWFNVPELSHDQVLLGLFGSTTGGDPGVYLVVKSNGTIRYLNRPTTGGSGGTNLYSSNICDDNKWHHLAAVKNGTTMYLYLDGVLETTGTTSDITSVLYPFFGKNGVSDESLVLNGQIDEVRIWNKALTQDEIRSQYGSLTGNEDSLVAYWRFDEGDGDYAYDATGNGHTGTLTNGPARIIPSTAPVADPVFTAIPGSVDFTATDVTGSSDETVLIKNTGGGILHIDTAYVDSAYFAIATTSANIFSGDSAGFTITYTPTELGIQTGASGFENNMGSDTVLLNAEGVYASSITIVSITSLSDTSVSVVVNIDSIGDPNSGYGLCLNSTGTPTVEDFTVDSAAVSATGDYTIVISNLEPAETYYLRAYIANSTLISYNDADSVIATSGAPEIATIAISDITASSASCEVYISNLGNPALDSCGVCVSTTSDVSVVNSTKYTGTVSDTGSYTVALTGLSDATEYYVAAYAISATDTVFGEVISFTAGDAIFTASETDTVELVVSPSHTVTDTITITNTGSVTMDITSIISDNSAYTISPDSVTEIVAGASVDFFITYSSTGDNDTCNIVFTGNAGVDTITIVGSVDYTIAADAGSALEFDGVDDYVYCEANTDLDVTNGTIEFWMNPAATQTSTGAIISQRSGSTTRYSIHMSQDLSSIKFWNGSVVSSYSYSFTAGHWYHVAMVTSGSNSEVYINGVSVGSESNGYGSNTNLPIYIGSSTGTKEYFTGQIDEVRVWSKALTQDEIRTQYGSLEGSEDNLIAYWRFDEGVDTVTYDATGNRNNGTLINGTAWHTPSTAPVADPVFTASVDTIVCDTTAAGDTSYVALTVKNTGGGILHVENVTADFADFTMNPTEENIFCGDSAEFLATYIPTIVADTISYYVFDDNTGDDTIAVKGYSVAESFIASITLSDTTISGISATVVVDSLGSATATEYGLCYSLDATPSLDDSITEGGAVTATGTYIQALEDLESNTTYYVCAYITTEGITTYSEVVSFTTYGLPVISTISANDISDTSATGVVKVSDLGNPALTKYGICLGTTSTLDIMTDATASAGSLEYTGRYGFDMTDLLPNTTYYFMAYAISDIDTVYGDVIEFTTLKSIPVITWATPDTITYGTALSETQLNATASYKGNAVTGTFTYNPGADSILDAGTQTLSVTFTPDDTDSYSDGSSEVTLIINKAELTVTVIDSSRTYGDANPEFRIVYSGFANGDDTDDIDVLATASCEASDTSSVGTYTVEASGASDDNYTFSYVTASLSISVRTLTLSNFTADDKVYDGTTSVTGAGFADDRLAGDLLTFSYDTAFVDKNVSTDKYVFFTNITISGGTDADNYVLAGDTDTAYADITLADLTIIADDITKTEGSEYSFDGTEYTVVGIIDGDTVTSATLSSEGAVASATEGNYSISISNAVGTGVDNYTISYVEGTMSVTSKLIPVISWNTPADISYGTALNDEQLNATVTYNDAALAGTFTYEPAADSILDAGSYSLSAVFTPADSSSYASVSATVVLTVTKVTLTITAVNDTIMTNAEIPEFVMTYSGFVNDEDSTVIDELPTIACETTSTATAGEYAITLTGGSDNNYEITLVNGTLTILDKVDPGLTISVSADITYGTAFDETQISTTSSVDGTFTYSVESGTILDAGENQAIVVTFTPTDTGNYTTVTDTVYITVAKAALSVVAEDASKVYGTVNPEFEITYSGFVNGETVAVLDELPTVSCSATVSSEPGTYEIAVSGGSDDNYEFSYTNGTLTVTPKTSVNENISSVISVYPNVVTDVTNVTIPNTEEMLNYSIVSVTGQLAGKGTLATGCNEIDMANYVDGIYFLFIRQGDSKLVYKLIKKQ